MTFFVYVPKGYTRVAKKLISNLGDRFQVEAVWVPYTVGDCAEDKKKTLQDLLMKVPDGEIVVDIQPQTLILTNDLDEIISWHLEGGFTSKNLDICKLKDSEGFTVYRNNEGVKKHISGEGEVVVGYFSEHLLQGRGDLPKEEFSKLPVAVYLEKMRGKSLREMWALKKVDRLLSSNIEWHGNLESRYYNALKRCSLTKDSVVYSGGVGISVDFEVSLVERYGVDIHLFDPTPQAVEFMRKKDFKKNLIFHDFGIGEEDGDIKLSAPEVEGRVSWSVIDYKTTEKESFPVRSISSLMDEYGHQRIDLLKLDIEGSEYPALNALFDDLSKERYPKQIMVEFHLNQDKERFREQDVLLRKRLRDLGYKESAQYNADRLYVLD